jgi:hypothetical protein
VAVTGIGGHPTINAIGNTVDLYLELDKRSTLPADSMLAVRYRDRTVHVDNAGNTDRCGRCGRETDVHAWRVIDLTDAGLVRDQKGVLDCAILGEEQ